MYRLTNRFDSDWSRFSAMSPFFADFERLFSEPGRLLEGAAERQTGLLNSQKTEDGYLINVDVPGLSETDISLDIHNQVLTLSGSKPLEPLEDYQATRRERRALKFTQSVRLPEDVDSEKVSATIKDGVLSVRLGKQDEVKPRQIKVAAS